MRILSEKEIRKDGQTEMIGNNDLSVVIATQSWIDKTGLQEVLQVISAHGHRWLLHYLWTLIRLSKY